MKFLPQTFLGKWSAGFLAAFFTFLLAGIIITNLQGPMPDQTVFSNPLLSITMILAFFFGVMAFFIGIISIIRKKERSILVIFCTVVGSILLFFLIGEMLVPH